MLSETLQYTHSQSTQRHLTKLGKVLEVGLLQRLSMLQLLLPTQIHLRDHALAPQQLVLELVNLRQCKTRAHI